jgi:hypothetical protein
MQFDHLYGTGIAVHYFGNILNISTFPPDYMA